MLSGVDAAAVTSAELSGSLLWFIVPKEVDGRTDVEREELKIPEVGDKDGEMEKWRQGEMERSRR